MDTQIADRQLKKHNLVDGNSICGTYTISRSTLHRYVASGPLPAYRIGPRLLRFDPDEVEAALLKGGR